MKHTDADGRPERRELAKQHAREHGYDGSWPPVKPPPLATAADFRATLATVEGGDCRAIHVYRLGSTILKFYQSLTVKDFERVARKLVEIARNKKMAARVRLRAIQATLAPLAAGVKLLAKLQARTSPAVLHLEACLGAFYGALEADMPTLINTLRDMTKVSNTTGIRASAALLKVTFEMVDALVTIRPRAEEAPVRDPARQAKIEADLAEMEQRILAKNAGQEHQS